MAKDILDFSKFKKIFSDEKNTHLKHPKGHTIIVAHVALSPKLKKHLDSLPMHPEEMIEKAVEMAQDVMEHIPHKAQGGEVPAVNRINMHFKDVTKRIPQLTEGAQKILSGEMGASEYDDLVKKHKPVTAYDFVPQPATPEEAMRALNESKRKMYGLTHEMKAGEPADLRLDIPAYKEHGVWVNSIHRKDAPTVYGSVSSVKNAQMVPSSEKALKVAAGGPKAPFAVIRGEWNPMDEGEAVQKAQKYLKHKDWKQVGYDPERHGYFYDRESLRPIIGAEEVIQIGPLVLAKKPTYGKKEEQLFAEGGEVDRPFKGYSSEKHARTGGLNDEYREKYNREHGSNLKRPVTGTPEPGSKDAARKKSFCARMKGVSGPTSEGGELTPKGAALKRWNCHAHGGMIEDDHDEECVHYAKGGRTSALLDKKGNKINKKSERERIFGDDANAPRMSDERMRMMNILRDKVKQEYGVGLRTAAGKRTESGDIRDAGVQPAFDVYTPEGHEAERRYVAEQKALNPKFKRIDPKPDWNNPDMYMDTQPSPDAGVHEVAHARQIPLGMTLAEHQDAMDALQGQVQKDYGFLQNKRTSHEIQPMAMENPIRRELGFPANSSVATGSAHEYAVNPEALAKHNAGRIANEQPPLETNEEGIPLTHDTKEPMYVAGLDHKGNVVYYMRQSRLMNPENRQRTEDIRQKTVKYHPQRGMVESMSGNALINLRGQGRGEEAERRLRTRGEERFAEGGQVGMDAIKKENYDDSLRRYYAYAGQVAPLTAPEVEDQEQEQPAHDLDRAFDITVQKESRNRQFDPKTGEPLTSPKGAIGVSQLMPETAPEAAALAGLPWDEERYRNDPQYNKDSGRAYFDKQYQDFGGELDKAYAAYNAGPGRTREAIKRAQKEGGNYLDYLPRETQDYVSTNMASYSGQTQQPQATAPQGPAQTPSGQQWEALPDDTEAMSQFSAQAPESTAAPEAKEGQFEMPRFGAPIVDESRQIELYPLRKIYNQKMEEAKGYRWLDDPSEQAGLGPKSDLNRQQWALNQTYKEQKALAKEKTEEQQRKNLEDARMRDIQAKRQYFGFEPLPTTTPSEAGTVGGAPAKVGQAVPAGTPSSFGGPGGRISAAKKPQDTTEAGVFGQDTYATNLNKLVEATEKAGEIQADIEKNKARALTTGIAEQQAIKNKFDKLYNDSLEQNNQLVDYYMNQRIDPMAVWNERSAPAKVATAIGLLLGGIGGGLTRQENPAMKLLQYQIDKSVEGQKMELGRAENLLKNNLYFYRNMSDALTATRAQVAEITARQIELAAAKSGDQVQKNLAEQKAYTLRMNNIFSPFMKMTYAKRLQNPESSDIERQTILQQMAVAFPEEARAMAAREVPNYMMANDAVDAGTRNALTAFNTFEQRATELKFLLDKFQGKTYDTIVRSLSPRQRAIIKTMADELLPQLADANRIQVSQGTKQYLEDQIAPGNPASLWNAFILNNAALEATIEGSNMKHRQLISSIFGEENTDALLEKNRIRNRRQAMRSAQAQHY